MGEYLLYALILVAVVLAVLLRLIVVYLKAIKLFDDQIKDDRFLRDMVVKYSSLTWAEKFLLKHRFDAWYLEAKENSNVSLKDVLASADNAEQYGFEPFTYIDHEPQSAGLDLSEHNRMHKRG